MWSMVPVVVAVVVSVTFVQFLYNPLNVIVELFIVLRVGPFKRLQTENANSNVYTLRKTLERKPIKRIHLNNW